MRRVAVAIIGAGPYGLSLATHLAARNVEHRIFGRPMRFWLDIAEAGGERYLKSYCFGTNISTPTPGYTFADYNKPRSLETFEPCSMANFAAYGQWFQQSNVPRRALSRTWSYERIRSFGNIASRSNAVSGADCARPFRGSALGQKPGGLRIFRERCTACPLRGELASSGVTCRLRVHGGFAIEWKTGCPSIWGRWSLGRVRQPVAWRFNYVMQRTEVKVS